MKFDYFMGVDPGLVHDPSGFVLVRSIRPAVVIRDGKIINADTGALIPLPKGVTVGEYCSPKYSIIYCRSRQGLTFAQTGREVRAVMADMDDSNFMACVDATGLGAGAVDAIRRSGCPAIGITLTSGSKITGSRWAWNVPVSLLFSGMFSLMAQGRLAVSSPEGEWLIVELKEIELRITDSGQEKYDVATGQDHHGDLCFALGLALIVAERKVGRMSRSVAIHGETHKRPAGRPRRSNLAKQVIKQRLEESRLQSEATMWAQIGADKIPDFD